MSRRYVVAGDQNAAASAITALSLESTTAIRPRVYQFVLGCQTDTLDFQIHWEAQRFITNDGAGTGLTPQLLDPGDPSAGTKALSNHTTEPGSYTANAFMFDNHVNTRAAYTWVAAHPGAEIILPAVDTEGLGWRVTHPSSTANMKITVYFWE